MKQPKKNEAFHQTLAMSKSERALPKVSVASRLTERESRIEKMLVVRSGCDFEIGKELYYIQQENDYAGTFEAYIKGRWERERAWGYKLIDAYKVTLTLPENVSHGIQNAKQALALKAAPKEERAAILSEIAVGSNGKITAVAIAKKIEEKKEQKPVEAEFRDVPTPKDEPEEPDEVTGEIAECDKVACADNRRLVKTLERKMRGLNLEIGRLREDKEAEMQRSPFYKSAKKVFEYWKEKTGHSKSHFSLDVFKQVLPFLKKDGEDLCLMAVEGIAFQHHKDIRLNGTEKKYDSFELCFRNRTKFEEYCCRSPRHKKKGK